MKTIHTDIFSLTVTSDGTTGEGWIKRLESKDFYVTDRAKSVLRSKGFEPTKGVTTKIVIFKGMLFYENDLRSLRHLLIYGRRQKLDRPTPEVACLIREALTNRELQAQGLVAVIVLHHPLLRQVLRISRGGGRTLDACYGHSNPLGALDDGFAFALSPP